MSSLLPRRLVLCSSIIGALLGLSGCAADGADAPASEEGDIAQSEDALASWGPDLLRNGGFEDSYFYADVPAAQATGTYVWSLYGGHTGQCGLAKRMPYEGKEGKYAMALRSSGLTDASAAQVVPATAGKTYRLRAFSLAYDPENASALLLKIEFLNSSKSLISTGSAQVVAHTTGDYQLNTVKATAPVGTRWVRVTALAKRRSDNGCVDIGFDPTVEIDGVRLEQKLPSSICTFECR